MTLQAAGTEFVLPTRVTLGYVVGGVLKALAHPSKLVHKVRAIVQASRRNSEKEKDTANPAESLGAVPPLNLQPGEWVRVRSKEEIGRMLDGESRTERLTYMGIVQDRFCGETLRVRTRVDRFFDERNWRMMKLKNVVLLEGAHCQSRPDDAVSWAGCQRSCFLFWKEAWLERVSPGASEGSAGTGA